jgi:hypothetical protein
LHDAFPGTLNLPVAVIFRGQESQRVFSAQSQAWGGRDREILQHALKKKEDDMAGRQTADGTSPRGILSGIVELKIPVRQLP